MNDDYTHRTIRRRGRLTRGDAASLIDAWQRSGLSQKLFCFQRGISLATFAYWRRRLRELPEIEESGTFDSQLVEVRLKDPSFLSEGWTFRLSGGIELCAPANLSVSDLVAIINSLHARQS